jgi:hypothetical protein
MTNKQIKQQEKLLKTGTGCDCYRFAKDVQGADIETLQAWIEALKK